MKLNSFVEVIRVAVVHDALVTIFTKKYSRQQRGLERDDDDHVYDDEGDMDPNWAILAPVITKQKRLIESPFMYL